MHWCSGLFLLLGVFIILPLELQFSFQHKNRWKGEVLISLFGMKHIIKCQKWKSEVSSKQHRDILCWNGQEMYVQNPALKQILFQIEWKTVALFMRKAIHVIIKWLQVKRLSIKCRVGFHRPDWTAYSYGLFWTAIAFLPNSLRMRGNFHYQPDFQYLRQDVQLEGIIRFRIGHIILIVLSLFWLTVVAILRQNWKINSQIELKRKESIMYES